MRNKTTVILIIISLLAFWVVREVFAGSLTLLFIVGAIALLFIIKLAQPWWVGLILGSLTVSFTIPYAILEKMPFSIIVVTCIITIFVGEHIIKKYAFNFDDFHGRASLLMFFTTVIVVGRFLYDRPFSAEIGTSGGGAQAIGYVVGVIAYFLMIKITTVEWDIKRNFNILIIILVLSASNDFVTHRVLDYNFSDGIIALFRGVFWGPFFFLPPLLVSMVLFKQEKSVTPKLSYELLIFLIIIVTFFLAFTTPFRTRPYFAMTMFFSVYFLFHKTKRFILMFLGSFILIMIILFNISDSITQSHLARSLSTIYSLDYTSSELPSSEMGWSSGFRERMYEDAIMEIKNNFFLGRGLSFSRLELMSTYAAGKESDVNVQGLMLSGGYHNSILSLAVNCGIPAALFFCFAFVLTLINFIRYMRRSNHNKTHLLGAGVLGFFTACAGQMLMNGGGTDFFVICSLMGFMNGLCLRGKDIDNGSKSFGQSRVAI